MTDQGTDIDETAPAQTNVSDETAGMGTQRKVFNSAPALISVQLENGRGGNVGNSKVTRRSMYYDKKGVEERNRAAHSLSRTLGAL